jgi:hypothetical protein
MPASDDYRTFNEKITGNLEVNENSKYYNVDAETVTVHENVKVHLFGTVRGKLMIRKNAKVFLHGQLLGELKNEEGRLYHFDE